MTQNNHNINSIPDLIVFLYSTALLYLSHQNFWDHLDHITKLIIFITAIITLFITIKKNFFKKK